jgi:radical SAM superfamily enzyme YgiQ (UPF0313 family)
VIVLYNPWSTPSAKKPLPMSLLALAAVLEGRHEYAIVDANLEGEAVDRIIERGRAERLDAVGVTVMPGPQLRHAVLDTRRIKKALPGVPIVWGGYFPSQHAETCLADPAVDFCVRGQGEETFRELASTLRAGGGFSSILGLSYKEGGRIVHNPRRPLIPLDALPDWPYERVPMERYLHRHYLGRRVGTHHSSYGCPFACNFCAIVELVQQRWMPQSPARVEGVLRLQKERYGIDAVQFHDMDFFVSEARTAELAERIVPLDVAWWALGRVDELARASDATWQVLKRSGLRMVFSGAESGSDETLRRMNKGGKATVQLTMDLVARLRTLGVVPELSFVLGNPPDPEADIEATLGFIRRLKAVNPATEVILYMYTPVPQEGTLTEAAREMGFRFPDTLDGWLRGEWQDFSLRRDPHTPWLSRRLQGRVRGFERVLNAYYPTTTDLRLRGLRRAVLRALGSWRYHLRVYEAPVELHAFHRLVGYQRPETAGF